MNQDKISVFGVGFIGKKFCETFPDKTIPIKSGDFEPKSKKILFLRSTTDNYGTIEENIEINLNFLAKTLNYLKLGDKFVFLSSWFVYNSNLPLPVDENAPTGGLGIYSATKSCAEKIVHTFCQTNNINFNIVRLSNVIGPGDKFSKKKNALTFLINEIVHGRDINLYHDGNFIRDYLDVEEIVAGLNFILKNGEPNEIYNLGSGVRYKMIDLLNYVREKTGSKSIFHTIEPPVFHNQIQSKDFYLDVSKLKSLGFIARPDMEKSLDRIIESLTEKSI